MRTKGPNPDTLFSPSNEAALNVYRQVARLKRLYRQGWLKRGVTELACESVADHSFGVAFLALIAPEPAYGPINRERAVLLALVHELGEVYAGDITPVDGVSKQEKARRERESLERVVAGFQGAEELRALWEDYETGVSAEARFVRELDRLELGIQASIYQAEARPRMEEFIASADRAVKDTALRRLLPNE